MADVAGNVLLVTIEGDYACLVSIDDVHLLFSAFGFVQKIITFEKAGFQALVQFSDTETASSAKNARDGRSIPSYLLPDDVGPCTTRITYSAHTDLSVKFQSHQSRDYTDADLPIAPSAIDGSGQGGVTVRMADVAGNVLLLTMEGADATKLFQIILKYMGVDSSDRVTSANIDERIELVGKLYEHTLKSSELRDELFVQILKQTRCNPDRQYLLKAWELMYLCAYSMPPSKDIGGYLSEYVHIVAHGVGIDSEVRVLALKTLNALKHAVKAGPRHTIPAREEIEALLTGRKLTTIVFFLDETFKEIAYDMATTVADAVEELAWIIKLSAYSSFSLFECRKVVTGSKSPDPGNEEYIGLDDNKYIGDLLAEFKAAKDQSEAENLHCNLTFKKKLFHESDEAVTDPMFVQLSYVQLQHDYILGNYPVGRDDAAQLSALQILVEIGFVDNPESCTDWNSLLERFLPRQNAIERAKREWELDILSCYRSMEHLTKDDARQQFLRILRTLLYGNSVFFSGDLPPNVEVRRKCVQDLAKAPKKARTNISQVALLEEKIMEARLAQLGDLMIEKNTKKDLIGVDAQLLQKLQGELKLRGEELHAAEECS